MAEAAAPAGNHSNKDKNRTPQIATAAYIVKGAAAKVLGTVLTIGTKFDNPKRGTPESPSTLPFLSASSFFSDLPTQVPLSDFGCQVHFSSSKVLLLYPKMSSSGLKSNPLPRLGFTCEKLQNQKNAPRMFCFLTPARLHYRSFDC
jgi:hypothetical protein